MKLRSSVFLCFAMPLALWSTEVRACGGWFLKQSDTGVRVDFSWKSVSLKNGTVRGLFDEKEMIPVEMTVNKRRIVIDGGIIREGALLIGRIADDQIEVHGRIHRVDISLNKQSGPFDYVISVRDGAQELLAGHAMSLYESCGRGAISSTLEPGVVKDLRHRIAFALVLLGR